MESCAYTLEYLMDYANRGNVLFSEIFVVYVIKSVSTELMTRYHMLSRTHSQIRPSKIVFLGGELKLTEPQQSLQAHKCYIPPEIGVTLKYDIWQLGQVLFFLTNAAPHFSSRLMKLLDNMIKPEPSQRLASLEVIYECNLIITRDWERIIKEFDMTYGPLSKSYALEQQNLIERQKREWEEIYEKKQRLTKLENSFFYLNAQQQNLVRK